MFFDSVDDEAQSNHSKHQPLRLLHLVVLVTREKEQQKSLSPVRCSWEEVLQCRLKWRLFPPPPFFLEVPKKTHTVDELPLGSFLCAEQENVSPLTGISLQCRPLFPPTSFDVDQYISDETDDSRTVIGTNSKRVIPKKF